MAVEYDVTKRALRLNNTICLVNHEPYYIMVDHDLNSKFVRGYNILERIKSGTYPKATQYETIDYTLDNFNCTDYNLGYVNHKDQSSYYVGRLPNRQFTQGLHHNYLTCLSANGRHVNIANYDSLWASEGFCKTLKGVFPSFEEAFNAVSSQQRLESAFHRDFSIKALNQNRHLFSLNRKGETLAVMPRSKTAFDIPKDRRFRVFAPLLDDLKVPYVQV